MSDVFDALIAANIRQQEAFVELLAATTKELKDYINDTKDDIGAPEIIQFLAAAAPPPDNELVGGDNFTKIRTGETLVAADVTRLNDALETPGDADVTSNNQVAQSGSLTQARVDAIMDAVAIRISANKYTILQQMVKQGALRLVVEDGTIETRLNFRTFGADYFSQVERQANRSRFDFRAKAKTGGLLSPWVKARASTSYTNIKVRTIDTRNRSVTNTTVNIFGGVKINFRTDYLPLDTE